MFDVRILSGKGDDIGAIIAQAVADNPVTAGTMGLQAFNKVLRRAAGATGSALFREVRGAFTKANPYGLKPLATHPSGALIAPLVENYFAQKRGKKMRPRRGYAAGSGFRSLMQYRMTPELPKGAPVPNTPPNIEVGLIPERRGGNEWAEKFRDWQQGRVLPYRSSSMYAMMAQLGLPISGTTDLTSPNRDVIGKVENKERPLEMFRQKLYERLTR
jgi:hypothetical protein